MEAISEKISHFDPLDLMDEEADEYAMKLKEGYRLTKFGFERLKELAREIQWADKHGYSVQLLEEEKKALEKEVLAQFKEYSGLKKQQGSFRKTTVNRRQAQLVNSRAKAEADIRDILSDVSIVHPSPILFVLQIYILNSS